MKRTVLFGAGQTGAMIGRLMGAEYELLCFADNNEKKWGTKLLGIPVLSPEDCLRSKPELVCLCVLDDVRCGEMAGRLAALGYTGELIRAGALKVFDARAATMRLLAEQINEKNIAGDAAELGVFRGEFASLINAALPERTLHLFDTFTGFDAADVEIERRHGFSKAAVGDFSQTDMERVRRRLPHPEKAEFHVGFFPDSFEPAAHRRFCFVSIDADLYAPTVAALPLFWERLSKGGVLMIHDVNGTQYSGAGRALGEFCAEKDLLPMPLCDLHGSVVLRK